MTASQRIDLAPFIEQTLLKPETTSDQIKQLCEEALSHSFKGVCVNSRFVSFAQSLLRGTKVLVVSVIGFPLGACHSESKRHEALLATSKGAQELDMVVNLGAVKERNWSYVAEDIRSVTRSVEIPVKVILETGCLTHEEVLTVSKIAEEEGARFIKTCTGFSSGSATVEIVRLMKSAVSPRVEVKASGGIKTYEQACDLIHAGATRLGTSSGIALIQGLAPKEGSLY